MVVDARTTHNAIEKPDTGNTHEEDFSRLILAIDKIDQILKDINDGLAGKAPTSHSHTIEAIAGLTQRLLQIEQGLADAPANLADLGDTTTTGVTDGMLLRYHAGKWQAVAAASDFIAITSIPGMSANSIQSALAELQVQKAATSALAAVSDSLAALTTGAPTTLNTLAKLATAIGADANFSATVASALGGKADAAHGHGISDITGLAEALSAKTGPSRVGCIIITDSTTPPEKTVRRNGATLSRTEFPELWSWVTSSGPLAASEGAKTSAQYGPGDGSTTFSLPDDRGETFRISDDGRGIDPGRVSGTWQAGQMPGHTHAYTRDTVSVNANSAPFSYNEQNAAQAFVISASNNSFGATTGSSGGSENRVRNHSVASYVQFED